MALKLDSSMLETDEGLLADVFIHMETLEDSFEKSIARYDYPFTDGADLEDMGQKAHVIRIRCWFWDDEENQSYASHTALLDALQDKDLIDFVHPKYGLIRGKIESIVIQHDDRQRACSIDITFVEQMRADLAVAAVQNVLPAVEESYKAAQTKQQSLLQSALGGILADNMAAVTKTLDSAQGLLAQMEGYASTTRAAVAEIEKYIATAEAAVNRIASPVNSLQATLTYNLTIPGRITGTLACVAEKVARLSDTLWNYPSQYIANVDAAMTAMQASFSALSLSASSPAAAATGVVMAHHLALTCAQRLALEAAALFAADNAASSGGGDEDFQVMTINELESTLAVVRARLAEAVEIARDMDILKTMAATLLTHVNSVRLEREKMIRVTLDHPLPIHLVCLKYGLPYQDADRLIRVNRISRPNYTDGEMAVYVR